MYVFWRKVEDPPSPWTRLTRTNHYLRFSSNTADHWTQTGSSAHTHIDVSPNTVGSPTFLKSMKIKDYGYYPYNIMYDHIHSLSISCNNNNNNPIGFGLDIIYVDLATWEEYIKSFPVGAVILSNGVLSDVSLERYSIADGKFIVHAVPETVVGTTTPQSHSVDCSLLRGGSGTSEESAIATALWYYKRGDKAEEHGHYFSTNSESKYVEPRNLVTRLYHVLSVVSKALKETVIFVDGSVGENWEILTSWAGGNIKAGNSNPTLSGSDTHTQTISSNSSTYKATHRFVPDEGTIPHTVYEDHYHTYSGSLTDANHVPPSRYIVPARLLNTLSENNESVIVVMT